MNESKIISLLKNISPSGYSEAISQYSRRLKTKSKTAVFTPNSEMLYRASRSPELYDLLLSADILFSDGIGVYMARRAIGISHCERTAGIELAELLMKKASECGYKIFLLGAKPGVAKKAAVRLRGKYHRIDICGHYHGYFNKSGKENAKVVEMINSSKADILFVCLGFPEQEKWIVNNLPNLKTVSLAIGLGGSLDVWSGTVDRAPSTISRLGLEWLWRTISDPKRLPRVKNLVGFSFFTLKDLLLSPKKQYKCYEIDNFLK